MLKIILCSFLIILSTSIFGSEGHDNDHKDEHKSEHGNNHKDEHTADKNKEEHADHDDDHGVKHGDKHEEHGKESNEDGFKLNNSAIKTFEIKIVKIASPQIKISKDAIYKGLNEVNVYRFRDGLFKRIDFKTLSQDKSDYLISSPDLKSGDGIVINGIGFLRMAEIAASGGLSDSHSH